jgi:hypothetical protein
MEKVTTDAVTALVDMWVTRVLATLDDEKAEIVNRVLNGDPNADLRVVFKLKQGVVLLEAERSDESSNSTASKSSLCGPPGALLSL